MVNNEILKISIGQVLSAKAEPHEVHALYSLFTETARWLHERKIRQWLNVPPIEFFSEQITSGHVFLFKLHDKIVGTVSLSHDDKAYWPEKNDAATYLHSLALNRDFSGHCLGKKIVLWSEQYAISKRSKFLRLDCALANPFLVSWYPTLGFRHIDDRFVHNEMVARFEKAL